MATFVLNLNHHPDDAQTAALALQFAQAVIGSAHQLVQVFFYQDAVHYPFHPSATAWQTFAQQHQVPLVVCHTQVEQRELEPASMAAEFTLSGLTEFATVVADADRTVSF